MSPRQEACKQRSNCKPNKDVGEQLLRAQVFPAVHDAPDIGGLWKRKSPICDGPQAAVL
jgi:hypothetical protein